MAQKSLGKVTTNAGTPVRLTANLTSPTAVYNVYSYMVQVLSANTGDVYIGNSAMVPSTGVGVYAVLPPPTANSYPSFSAVVAKAAGNFDMSKIYIDVENSTDGVIVSIVEA